MAIHVALAKATLVPSYSNYPSTIGDHTLPPPTTVKLIDVLQLAQESSVTLDNCAQQDSKQLFSPSPLAELHDNVIAPICWPFQCTNLLSSDESQHPSWVSLTELEEFKSSDEKHEASKSYICHVVPPPCSSMEAYLLLETAWSDHQISLMRKDLAYEIVHHNTIALQLNCIMLEMAEADLLAADELVGHIQLTIRQSGHSAAVEYVMQESWPHHPQAGKSSIF
ncbi:hypothetical protein PISMIDRAFT_11318 [Pisolithus microcarpus 441]|uniref:Unplaced genomic scaffold scaffold_50, whole genome shotgun sequence n=1 Tax=Pisolithus microcarpus 441 TaxID=765257 RepID=A0A0C9Z194_9AGAM|nr:hypothetical protein BKA83DRAFT_11318 [Pisolithus microcarpus]KIK22851.1 hypothetical protein PISMIDRAFT_11318 [Pisolithus microcarpus 441]